MSPSATLHTARTAPGIDAPLARIPGLAGAARARGGAWVIAWLHRISGIVLAVYLWFHLVTLSRLADPAVFDAHMALLQRPLWVFLEWLLAVPVVFHALNGARLTAYEIFGLRRDAAAVRWVMGGSAAYVLTLGALMLGADQTVTAAVFWLPLLIVAGFLGILAWQQARRAQAAALWRWQRIGGAVLLVLVPAHMLLMHLTPQAGHDAATILARTAIPLVKAVDFILLAGLLFHSACGLLSIAGDYVVTPAQRWLARTAVIGATVAFGVFGIRVWLL